MLGYVGSSAWAKILGAGAVAKGDLDVNGAVRVTNIFGFQGTTAGMYFSTGRLRLRPDMLTSILELSTTQVLITKDGTAGAPGWGFSGETGLGMRRSASGRMRMTFGGSDGTEFALTHIRALNAGTEAFPFYSFNGATGTGWWLNGATLAASVAGTRELEIGANVLSLTGGTALRWGNNQKKIVNAADRLEFTADGNVAAYFSTGSSADGSKETDLELRRFDGATPAVASVQRVSWKAGDTLGSGDKVLVIA